MHPVIRHTTLALLAFGLAFAAATGAQWALQRSGWMPGLFGPATADGAQAEAARAQRRQDALAEALNTRHHGNPLQLWQSLPADRLPARRVQAASHPSALPAWGQSERLAAATSRLQARLLIDGTAHPVQAQVPVALPGGSRFRLEVRSDEPAALELHTIAPDGQASGQPLWHTLLAADTPEQSPALRLAGPGGIETLRLVRRSLRTGEVTEQRVQLLHHAS